MLTAFTLEEGLLVGHQVSSADQLPLQAIWIDLLEPIEEEQQWIRQVYQQDLPTPEDVVEIEASSRFFTDEGSTHIHSYFFHEFAEPPRNVTVAFVLNQGCLITLRDEELAAFRLLQRQIRHRRFSAADGMRVMLRLFEIKVDQLADLIERLYLQLESVSQKVFNSKEKKLEDIILELAEKQDIIDKLLLNLMDKRRVLSFLLRRQNLLTDGKKALLREILDDVQSLNEYSRSMFERIDFLMNATMGLINTEQNKIIKIFSIAAVVFLPPTMVASIYGMNFEYMPELSWILGYPLALLLMVVSGLAPYWYFKRKGWL
jgi:magnesium transporter